MSLLFANAVRRLATLLLPLALLTATAVGATAAPAVLRVAADPNNLPFSNRREEGFENALASLLARELGMKLEYQWWPQRRGFFRETLGSGRADVVLSVPVGFERVLTTRPYYRSSYVFVYRRGTGTTPFTSFDDPRLRALRVGVQLIGDDATNAPPAHALSARGIVTNIRGYTVYGDYAHDSPPSAIIAAVASGEIDVAVAWGPMAAYFAKRSSVPLAWHAVSPESDGPALPFTFALSIGVRRGNDELRRQIDEILKRRKGEIDAILDQFGIPQLPLKQSGKESIHVAQAH